MRRRGQCVSAYEPTMSRSIRFRVWNESRKLYIRAHYIGEEAWVDENGIYDPETSWGTLEQFTGLKDSQGKEIYEGDIVEQPYLHVFSGTTESIVSKGIHR